MKCRKWVELISKANDLRSREESSHTSRRISNGYKGSAVADEFAQDMELDEQPRAVPETNGTKAAGTESGRNRQYDHLLAEAMEYGQELQRDYRDSPDGEQKALLDIFSLVAYDNPRESVHGSLLDRKGRVAVAEELNSAILGKFTVPGQLIIADRSL